MSGNLNTTTNSKEAQARIKINKLLEQSGWRFFDDENGKKFYQKFGFKPEKASKYKWLDEDGKVITTNNEQLMKLELG